MAPMVNIRRLLNSLQINHWHITAFLFAYKAKNYIVLFEDIANLKLNETKYIVLLTFIDKADENRTLRVKANENEFKFNVKEFREYFGIEFTPNLGDIFKQFYQYFGNFVPEVCEQNFDDDTKRLVVNKLSQNDKENSNNLCCYAARRNGIYNGVQHHRTPFNSDKTRLLRNNLYNMLGRDDTISFCYRESDSLSDTEIYNQFAQRYGIR